MYNNDQYLNETESTLDGSNIVLDLEGDAESTTTIQATLANAKVVVYDKAGNVRTVKFRIYK